MKNFDFKLTPAYCLFNGVAVVNQNGSKIIFLLENMDNVILKQRLSKAFGNYLNSIVEQKDCPEEYRNFPDVSFIKGNHEELRKYISSLYEDKFHGQWEDFYEKTDSVLSLGHEESEASAVLLLDKILHSAKIKGINDIYIEEDCVKFKISENLEKECDLLNEKKEELIQRIKLLAGLNILDTRSCQEGYFVFGNSDPIFVKVFTFPDLADKTKNVSESIVLRILDSEKLPLTLENLGFNSLQYEKINSILNEKSGLVLICGPIESGKSTTSAALLLELQKRKLGKLKIISLEDSLDYEIPGLRHVNKSLNMDCDDSIQLLQEICSQDADVIMFGEIKDKKSAEFCIKASLTGHLVIASLYTQSVTSSVLCLENFGIGRRLLSSVLKGVLVQNLECSLQSKLENEENDFVCQMDDNAKRSSENLNSWKKSDKKNNKIFLLADLCLPIENFSSLIDENMSEEDLDSLFLHISNFNEVLKLTIPQISNANKKFLYFSAAKIQLEGKKISYI